MNAVPKSEWKAVTVAVAPSTVTISFEDPSETTLDCRVRFLSFLGIGESSQQCAFIMHTAQERTILK
jgi:amyloid beta (A4) precursor protein-binding family B protein 2 (Fe65-like)